MKQLNAVQAQVIQFPKKRRAPARKPKAEFPYFNESQIKMLRRTVRDAAILAHQKGQVSAIRDWVLIDLLTSSGLREAEAADLRCGDIKTGYGECAIFVRNGKGSKSRTVQIPASLKKHVKSFLKWKADRGEPTGPDDYLFIGQRGPWTPAAVQQAVKKWLRKLNLYEPGKSAHALRHSYAVALYRAERDLRAVQKQLGHASIQTTMIYADTLPEDIQSQLKGLWN
jgi:integrase/recombinase XerD